ncbi:LysR substrate-binding domain-containing protein [Corynebacterium sp. 153RC1]|uniref:LysR family transcriptional regulator n=1 Tax=unclassified Corynebacterium TaxID=2624378 RepID=UPI00211C0190|nr:MULTISPECIES: LysR substrate-binding domain-containing protein [unclassified Corynebacterium]MCQ9370412.1 LysR substrate-binding domain-containing protein [Corynebacterium sp. 35RC1]MCQ9353291.1 LysR substrate-binding domain-containing protein [Corynebacterium sp. 209RC1]MCQ9355431.1 LysR substrate-binding domain-containing protein [Corynebacterium sp. 1222RC1]MCQ9357654.1 LysR substrate-binding domain-containing protein [Corynebacterium sp. 122RC1]MCQ9359799.1 LysR substrate-binding domain
MLEVEQARAFLVLSEELHFGRAADRLNIAQPPLSRIIKQLERQLKVQLFERSTRHVELTAAGKALVEPARKLVEVSDAAVRTVRDAATGNLGTVKLGFAGASVHQSVGQLAREVQSKHPGIDLELYSSQLSPLGLQKVQKGEIDAVIGRWDFLPAEISSMTISREELVLAVPLHHPLARAGATKVKMNQLAEENWIVLPGGSTSALLNRFNLLARRGGFIPKVRTTSPDSWTLLVLVGAGMGVAMTLDSVRRNVQEKNVHYLEIDDPERFLDLQLIWHSENTNPALGKLVSTVEALHAEGRMK